MKKLIRKVIIVLFFGGLICACIGCGIANDTEKVEKEQASQENTEPNYYSVVEEETEDRNSSYYQGNVDCIVYRERDNLFSVFDNDGNQIFINLDGNILENTQLMSRYLQYDRNSENSKESRVIDLYGNDVTNEFVKDSEHEKVIGICQMTKQDVVWVMEYNETPEHSQIIVKAFDEDGNKLCSVDSDNPYFNEFQAENFKYIVSVQYMGDSACQIEYSRASTQGLFSINVETGEILNPEGIFSDGYAVISGQGIQDIHGEYLVKAQDGGTDLPEMLYNTYRYSDGLFFSQDTQKFYDIKLNEKIDLSEYNMVFWEGDKDSYVFKDGYCGIEVENDAGTRFYGLIDTEGNWIIDLTDTLDHSWEQYNGKISENKLKLGSDKVYNMITKEFEEYPWLSMNNSIRVNGKCYYINETDEICVYDIEQFSTQML